MSSPPRACSLSLCAAALSLAFASCAGTGGFVAKAREFSITDLRPAKVEVVEVRKKDLKPLPTGEERALAYQRSSRRSSWLFGPVDFEEPELPAEGAEIDGGLLPSLD